MRRLGIALILLLGAVAVATTPCRAQAMSIEGTWQIKVWYEDFLAIQYLQTFTQDGKTTIYLPFGGPVNANDSRVACTGEWRRAGAFSFDVTMYCLWSQEWEFAPDRIRAKLTLQRGAQAFTDCPFTYEWVVDGEYVGGWGLMTGTRLPFVPLD
jgi:hypothetical protein